MMVDDGAKSLYQIVCKMPSPKCKGVRATGLLSQKAILQTLKQLVTSPEVSGDDIKKLRAALGISQRQLAKILRVSAMTIVRAERDAPSRALILYIDRALADGSLKLSDRKVDPK